MKLKKILFSASICMMAALTSCQSQEEVINPTDKGILDLSNCETVSVAIGIPDDGMKTRAGEVPGFSYGADGLLSFSRTIDKLWYGIYHNGVLIYHSMQPGVPQARYNAANQSFALDIQIPRLNEQINLSEYSVFFMAGNALDNVDTKEITDGIGLDFANKIMYAYPSFINRTTVNGSMYDPEQYDFFCKYTTLDKIVGTGATTGNITLTRPFCQVSLLTDELCQPNIINAYSNNSMLSVETVPYITAQKVASSSNTLVYGWNYGTDALLTKDASDMPLTLNARVFDNSTNAYSIPQQVNFNDRRMYCLATYLMLAPDTKAVYDSKAQKSLFGFNLNVVGNTGSTNTSIAVEIPSSSLRANEKYVLYNKHYNSGDRDDDGDGVPDTPTGGDGGLFSTHYAIDIVVDPSWQSSNNSTY